MRFAAEVGGKAFRKGFSSRESTGLWKESLRRLKGGTLNTGMVPTVLSWD